MKKQRIILLGLGMTMLGTVLLASNVAGKGLLETPDSVEPVKVLHLENAPISPAGLPAVIFDGDANIVTRVGAVHALGENLTPSQITALYDFLQTKPDPRETNLGGLRFLKNEIFTALRNQEIPPAQFPGILIAIYRDMQQDFVTRDYALQHLASWAEQELPDGEQLLTARETETERNAGDAQTLIESVFLRATEEKNSLSGTALLGLDRMDRAGSTLESPHAGCGECREIERIALHMASSEAMPTTARITAIQICGERQLSAALPLITTLAQKRSPLQISAIAALGHLGGVEADSIIRSLATQTNPTLEPAIEGALKNIAQRKILQLSAINLPPATKDKPR